MDGIEESTKQQVGQFESLFHIKIETPETSSDVETSPFASLKMKVRVPAHLLKRKLLKINNLLKQLTTL